MAQLNPKKNLPYNQPKHQSLNQKTEKNIFKTEDSAIYIYIYSISIP